MRTSQLNEITKPLPHRVSIENQLKLSLRPLQRYFLALFVFCSFGVFFSLFTIFYCASSRLVFDSAAADTHTTLYSCVQARITLNLTENGYNSPQRVSNCAVWENSRRRLSFFRSFFRLWFNGSIFLHTLWCCSFLWGGLATCSIYNL